MADRIKEHIKSGIIVLLLITALLLLYYTGYYSSVVEKMGLIINTSAENSSIENMDAFGSESFGPAQAMEISVSARDGHRYSSIYNSDQVDSDYSRFSAFLAEALGSAGDAETRDEAEWIRAVESESVYIRYFAPQSLSYLASMLGTSFDGAEEDILADEFCLCIENDRVCLYYRNDHSIFRRTTAVSQNVLLERVEEFTGNQSHFSHASSKTEGIKKSVIVVKEFSEVPEIKSGSVSSAQIIDDLMNSLAINEYTTSSYIESDGTRVYIDGNCVLRVSSSGYVDYTLSGDTAISCEDGSLDSAIDLCWRILNRTAGANCGGAGLYMSGVERSDNDQTTILFDYIIEGIPVLSSRGHAAVFQFYGTELDSLELNYRSYTHTGANIKILPMYQAAAIASSKGCNTLSLMYYEIQDNVECIWVNE